MESMTLQDAKSLRSGKYVTEYRESTMMAEFEVSVLDHLIRKDESEDEDYVDGQEDMEEEEEDVEEEEEEEDVDQEELRQIVAGVEHVAADTMLKPIKVLRHGKQLPSEEMEAVTAKIQQMMSDVVMEKEL
jgi:hypothetical protein